MRTQIHHSNDLLILLLALSAIFELIGTATVAYNYFRTGKVAKQLVEGFNPEFSVTFEDRKKPILLAKELTPKMYLTIGLIAYFLGAILGFFAGLTALYRW